MRISGSGRALYVGNAPQSSGRPTPETRPIHIASQPPNRRPNSADFPNLFCRFVGFLNTADLFC